MGTGRLTMNEENKPPYCAACGDRRDRHEDDSGPCTRLDCTCMAIPELVTLQGFTWRSKEEMEETMDELARLTEDMDLYNRPDLQESLAQLHRGEVEPAQTAAEETQQIDMQEELAEGRGHSRWVTSAERARRELEDLKAEIRSYADDLSSVYTATACQVREDLLAMVGPCSQPITLEQARALAQRASDQARRERRERGEREARDEGEQGDTSLTTLADKIYKALFDQWTALVAAHRAQSPEEHCHDLTDAVMPVIRRHYDEDE
jgi:hypothetical protein